MLPDPIAVTLLVTGALEALEIPYLIGGSLASALQGVVRATMDAGVVADLGDEHAEPLAQSLPGSFYVDAEAIRDAVAHKGSFNAIHLATMFKVDVFVSENRPFDQSRFARRVLQRCISVLPPSLAP